MIPLNPWEHQNAIKTLYSKCVEGICTRHGITRMELDILLFLANNPCFDTATDIVEIRYLSKSQVSSSIKTLEERGYIRREYRENNKKTVHLRICEEARPVITDGREAQERFADIMLQGVTEEERECMRRCFDHICRNIDEYFRQMEKDGWITGDA
ncbi:MAG: MarR family transcriptional regulator [Acetatifactor sp.]|nr:MarR family transcriptional regulator [Acetatifactor sp.]